MTMLKILFGIVSALEAPHLYCYYH